MIAEATSHISQIGIRTQISYTDIAALVESELPQVQSGKGQKQLCDRVLGIKICGTTQWQYSVERSEEVNIGGHHDQVIITLPLNFKGKVGLQGDIARLLNIEEMDFDGALQARIYMGFDLSADWCPIINSHIEYHWTQSPRIEWIAGVDFNLQEKLDSVIAKQLEKLEDTIADSIDCQRFRNDMATHWRSYSIMLDIPSMQEMYLNLVPTSFAFSGMHTNTKKIGMAFLLEATSTLQATPIPEQIRELPSLRKVEYQSGKTVFNLLIRTNYSQLHELAAPAIVGKSFSSESIFGAVSIHVKSLSISGNTNGITIGIGFDADVPGVQGITQGQLYLSAAPVVDTVGRQVRLHNIALSKVVDNKLWSAISTVFERQIIQHISQHAVLDFDQILSELERRLLTQLSDPQRTGGLHISAQELNIELIELHPEQASLAALLRVSTDLDIDIPAALFRPPVSQ